MRGRTRFAFAQLFFCLVFHLGVLVALCSLIQLTYLWTIFVSTMLIPFTWPVAVLIAADFKNEKSARAAIIGSFIVLVGSIPFAMGVEQYFQFVNYAKVVKINQLSDLRPYATPSPLLNQTALQVTGFTFEKGEYLMAYAYSQVMSSVVSEDHMLRTYYTRYTIVPLVDSASYWASSRSSNFSAFNQSLFVLLISQSPQRLTTCYESCWPSVDSVFGTTFPLYATLPVLDTATLFMYYRLAQTMESLAYTRVQGALAPSAFQFVLLQMSDPHSDLYNAINMMIGSAAVIAFGFLLVLLVLILHEDVVK